MLKKSLLFTLLLALLVPWAANAQTRATQTFDFEDGTIPSTWTNDADYPWVVVSESQGDGHTGTYCIKSGNSGVNSSSSTISATFTFVGDGSISFLGGCWGEGTSTVWDKCIFSIDGTEKFSYGARDTWETYSFEVETGTHTFTWSFTKDSSVAGTGDAFFVDDVVVDLGVANATPKPLNFAVSGVTAHEATLSWDEMGTATEWQIMLNNDEDNLLDVTENPYTLTGLTPETSYTAKVRSVGVGEYSAWSNQVSFTTTIACPAPTDLAAALTPGDGSVATLSWTSSASEWVLAYKTADDTDFTEETVTENPYTLTGLTPETTYTAKVKSVCGGEDGESAWSSVITFTPTNAYNLTVNDGTTTNNYVPVYGTWVDNITKSQFIIPAADLAAMQWGTINQMTYYANTDKTWDGAQFEVYMTETSETTLSALADYSSMEKVMNAAHLEISGNQMVVTLDAPYQYLGGNLLIGFLQTVSGTWGTSGFYGVSAPAGSSMGGYGSSVNQQSFLPKVTFAYTPGVAPAYPKPTGLAVNYTVGSTAEVSWNSEATAWNIDVNGTVIEGVTENPYTLTGLELATTYSVMVQAVFGSNTSDWTNPVSFTTDLCLPENMCVINITLNDSYGDGWSGGKMEVVDALTNEVLGTFTLTSGETDTFTPEFCIGRKINFVYTAGSYGTENGWVITDINGDVIAQHDGCSSGCTVDNGIIATHTVACPSCVKPNITLGEVTHTTANLTWNDKGVSYVLRYRTAESIVPAADAFTDDFENGIDNWTIYQEGEAGGNWAIAEPSQWTGPSGDPLSAHSGQYVAMARSYFDGSGFNADNWLVSPELTIPAVMSFWVMGDATFPETYSICVSTTDNAVDSFTAIATYTENPEDWTLMTIDLSAYEGETGYIAFHQYGYDADLLLIDDVILGAEIIPAGTWTEIPTTELSYEITGLTADTKYDYQIKTICSDTDESDYTMVASFTTLSDRVKLFVTEGNWNEAANWVPEGEPTAEQDVVIRANVVIPEGVIAQAMRITQESGTITIKDGAELEYTTGTVTATVEKAITGYTGTRDHYYLLSSPLGTAVSTAVENLLTNDYDYYWFNGAAEDEEWQNYEASTFNMKNGWGYLYANSQTTTLRFTGTLKAPSSYYYAGGSETSYLTYNETTSFGTFNLLGNVFARKGYLMYYDGTNVENITDFYVMGDGKLIPNTNPYLLPCQGAMIQATTTNQLALVGVEPYPTSKNANGLNMTVTANNETVDVARIRFNEGHGLQKIQFGKNDGKLYMPVEGKDYAVAYTNDNAGEMPVNFKAEKNGSYTISFNTDNIEFGYLHLIDNMTGADVDLLESASYTFDAQTTDFASRFKLVFATGNNNDNPFAFISNGEIILNGIDGNTNVQLFDVTGRMISSTNGNSRISTENMAAGVYMIRLINGNDVKTQKIVVK